MIIMEENKNIQSTQKKEKKSFKDCFSDLFKKDANKPRQNALNEMEKYKLLSDPKPILYVDKLYKKYPRKKSAAINSISFKVFPGQFHAFIGANGAGKTTTIKSVIGAYARWTGTVLINGHKNTSEQAKKSLGYIPENARFPAKMNCLNYLIWMARLSGLTKAQAKEFATNKLNELKMWNLRKKSPNTFSSGQKKKVLLAQALIHDPEILIMDEPAANLDPKARIEFFDVLLALIEKGKAIFVSSHILTELDRYANAATILDGGKIIFTGTTKELFEKYADKEMAIDSEDNKKMLNFFKKNKITYKYDDIKNWYITKFKDLNQQNKFFKYMSETKNSIKAFNEIGANLDDIYKKLIKLGSVDTMEQVQANQVEQGNKDAKK